MKFDVRSWKFLGGFLARKKPLIPVRGVASNVGKVLGWLSALGFAIGLRAFLPPDGTYGGFVGILPWWVLALPLAAVAGIFFFLKGIDPSLNRGELSSFTSLGAVAIGVLIVDPIVLPMIIIFWWGVEVVERSISYRRFPLWQLVLLASISAITGWVSGYAIPLPEQTLLRSMIAIAVFIGFLLYSAANSFEENRLAVWLRAHPRGNEVLAEFSR
jgi:hypothetical protein